MNEKNKKRVNIDKKTLIMLGIDVGVVMGAFVAGMATSRTIEASRRPEDRLATLIRLWERGVIQLKDGDHVLTDDETAVAFMHLIDSLNA